MPDAPAATPVLSTTRTSSPAFARCHAVDRPWTPAPTTRCLTEAGREGGTGGSFAASVAYNAIALPGRREQPSASSLSMRAREPHARDAGDHEAGEPTDRDQPAAGLGDEVDRQQPVRHGGRERRGRQCIGKRPGAPPREP